MVGGVDAHHRQQDTRAAAVLGGVNAHNRQQNTRPAVDEMLLALLFALALQQQRMELTSSCFGGRGRLPCQPVQTPRRWQT